MEYTRRIAAAKREHIALQIFTAMMARSTLNLNPHPTLGEFQVKTAFILADTFLAVADDARPKEDEREP